MNAPWILLLLHGNGWDELLMVAVGLVLAFAVITLTGRQRGGADDVQEVSADEPGERDR